MGILEIVSIVVFPISLSSFILQGSQSQTPMLNRAAMFRSEAFGCLIFVLSFPLMIASGVIIGLYSWVLLVALLAGTVIAYPLFGCYLVRFLWLIPFMIIDRWSGKR